jgi:hypothetical protein
MRGIIYQGPSLYDGAPIVVVATYSDRNTKTGGVVQTYILRADMNPLEASKTGEDVSICGTCPHRGTPTSDPARKQAKGRKCYVNLGQGVLITWRSFQRGVYPDAQTPEARRAIGRGNVVRIGTYGDPAAVPAHVWEELLADSAAHTAYTHASGWRPDLAMQSADTLEQAQAHWQAGRRTFRVQALRGHRDPLSQIRRNRHALARQGRPIRAPHRPRPARPCRSQPRTPVHDPRTEDLGPDPTPTRQPRPDRRSARQPRT